MLSPVYRKNIITGGDWIHRTCLPQHCNTRGKIKEKLAGNFRSFIDFLGTQNMYHNLD